MVQPCLRIGPCVLVVALAVGNVVAEDAPEEPPEILVCTDANGNVTYQIDPCDAAPPRRRVEVAHVPAPPKAQAALPKPLPPVAPAPRRRVVLDLDEEEPKEGPRGPADPRLGSPEQTWRTLLGALRAGDRALAAACLTSSALAESGSDIDLLPLEMLRERADTLPEIDLRGTAGPFRVAVGKGSGPRPKWIFFEKTRNGDWKIAAM